MTLVELNRIELDLARKLERHIEETKKTTEGIIWELRETKRQKEMLLSGASLQKIQLAEHIISIRGEFRKAGDAEATVREAISELAENGGVRLKRVYLGCKNYDGFFYQGISAEYGFGPRHGYVVFAIEMTKAARAKVLEADEIEAAVYLLELLLAGKYLKPAASA